LVVLKIRFTDRFLGAYAGAYAYVSLDGTDCVIYEQTPFSGKWYSHKTNGPAVRYEIGLNIRTGVIVLWVCGGVPAGEYPDLKLARMRYTREVEPGELTIADKGYRDNNFFITPNSNPESTLQQKKIMARHESINARIKAFKIVGGTFRHAVDKHQSCFYAVANIVQLMLLNGHPLANIDL